MHDVPYHKAVGSLMYVSLRTCPNISFAVQTVSCFFTKPRFPHWKAAKRIICYLKGTIDLWLSYGHAKIDLARYADADGSMAKDRHTISGYIFIIHRGAIFWSAKCQEIVLLLNTKGEYVATC